MADVVDAKSVDADVVKAVETAIPEPEVEEAVAKIESEDPAAKTIESEDAKTTKIESEYVKTSAENIKPEDAEAKEDEDDFKKDSTTSTSKSSGHKRKNGPHPPSAHDRNQRKKFNANIVSRFDDQPESNEADDIRRQVEFYFSDSNLPIDAFLLGLTRGHENHGVDLKIIHNFKRMQHFQPYSAVRDAVKASTFLNLNDNDEITRKNPLADKYTDDPEGNRKILHSINMLRSIYAKGFGDETKRTHLDIEAFFEPYGPIRSVRLRRTDDGAFKGSVFVEFQDEETQKRFLELDPKPQWQGNKLDIRPKQDYVDIKHKGILDGIVKAKSPSDFGNNTYKYNDRRKDGRDRRGNKDRYNDKDDWKARRERDQRSDRRGGGGFRGRDRYGGGNRGGDRKGRRGRRDSPDGRDWKRRRSESQSSEDSRHPLDRTPPPKRRRSGDGESKEDEDRITAEPMKVKTDEDARENGGDASAGAEKVETNGAGEKVESKKRALEDEAEGQGEGKKIKAGEES